MDDVHHRWPLPELPELREQLLAAWTSPDRGYHDLTHLVEVLDHLDLLAGEAPEDLEVLRLAAWFHDAVYEGLRDDEERSARWALEALADLGVGEEVARLVRLTATHQPEPGDRLGALLCDADLAILASGAERYADYVAGVRREYAHLDDATFAAGRTAVLESLADGELFHTEAGRARWEAAARANLTAELASLRTSTS